MRIISTRELSDAGVGRTAIRTEVGAGRLLALRRGLWQTTTEDADTRTTRVARIGAGLAVTGTGVVASHLSALDLWRLPAPAGNDARVWITRGNRGGGGVGKDLHLLKAPLAASEVEEVDGLPVTSVARTVTDTARYFGFEAGVIVADAALHRGLVDCESLLEALDRGRRRPGNAAARAAVRFADARAESPGESSCRVMFTQQGIPAPVLQAEIRNGRGLVARVDFLWEALRLVGEYDGEQKYALDPGASDVSPIMHEKRREEALRAMGYWIIRFTKQDLRNRATASHRWRQVAANQGSS